MFGRNHCLHNAWSEIYWMQGLQGTQLSLHYWPMRSWTRDAKAGIASDCSILEWHWLFLSIACSIFVNSSSNTPPLSPTTTVISCWNQIQLQGQYSTICSYALSSRKSIELETRPDAPIASGYIILCVGFFMIFKSPCFAIYTNMNENTIFTCSRECQKGALRLLLHKWWEPASHIISFHYHVIVISNVFSLKIDREAECVRSQPVMPRAGLRKCRCVALRGASSQKSSFRVCEDFDQCTGGW